MLFAKFLFTIAPATGGHASGHTRVNARGVNGHGCTKAVAHHPNAGCIDLGTGLQKVNRGLGVLHLLHANHFATLALAVTATTHVKAQGDIAQ